MKIPPTCTRIGLRRRFAPLALASTVLTALALTGGGAEEPFREFRDIRGNSITARILSGVGESVDLVRRDGRKFNVRISVFAPEDRVYIRQALGRIAAEARASAAAEGRSGPGDWTQWRGPARDGGSTEAGLLQAWPDGGPPLVWTAEGLGKGYSSVAVHGDRIYSLGDGGGATSVVAVNRADGELLWSTPVRRGGGANGTPTVDPATGRVYAVTKGGTLICVEGGSGEEVWSVNFERDLGGKMMSGWGYSESPLIDGDRVICTPGAPDALLAALDKATGKTVWKTDAADLGGRGKDGAGYASVVVSEAGGVKQYVTLTGRGVVGADAETGELLWHYNDIANGTANIPTPVVSGDLVFCSSGYGTGSALLRLSKRGSRMAVKELVFHRGDELQNHHGGFVRVGDYVYGGHGHNKGEPFCLELDSGKIVWKVDDPAVRQKKSAAFAYADGHLYIRHEDGTLTLAEATPKGYREKSRFQLPHHQGPSWNHPVIAGGFLYIRTNDYLLAYDVREKG